MRSPRRHLPLPHSPLPAGARPQRAALALAALLLLTAGGLRAEATHPITLRAAWAEPVSGDLLSWDYAGPPLLLVAPGAEVRCWLFADGQAVSTLAICETPAGGEEQRHDLPAPAEGVRFHAPAEPGVTRLSLAYRLPGAGEQRFALALSVPHPARGAGPSGGDLVIGRDALGTYGDPRKSRIRKVATHPEAYAPPTRFARLAPDLEDHWLTPRIPAGWMVIPYEKTGERHTRWFPARGDTLRHLEALLSVLEEAGLPVAQLRPLSLFRAPAYNRKVGSGLFSRHPYGDAMDFFFDGDDDGAMDDLTGDGRVNLNDALRVIRAVEAAQAAGRLPLGGIGAYYWPRGGNRHRLTFHIDFRGHRATWGYQYDRRGRREFTWESKHFDENGKLRRP